ARKTADIRFLIAELLEESGDPDRALEEYMNVYYLFEKDEGVSAKALLRVARIYENRERWDEWHKILVTIASLNVPEAKYARERLKGLEEEHPFTKSQERGAL
ncbi:MAG: hypothetical protein PHH75_07750, partial [Candidatus Omnitrophica bacterium]|nr:hypothetical protein [Candidatus Omnitrophota bacterium]